MDTKEKLFREDYLFTREDILKSLELFVEHERLNEEPAYSNEVVKNRVKLCGSIQYVPYLRDPED